MARVAGHDVSDMASARAEIERPLRAELAHARLDRIEVRSARMNRAFDIGPRLRAELRLDDLLMRLNHESAPLRSSTALRSKLVQA